MVAGLHSWKDGVAVHRDRKPREASVPYHPEVDETGELPTYPPFVKPEKKMKRGYAILFFTTLDFTSITSHIYNWALFLLWLCLFILFGVISSLIFSSILSMY